ncbi:MAG: hypothetical protein ACXWHF_09010 [Chthoniobacterales bacterium]
MPRPAFRWSGYVFAALLLIAHPAAAVLLDWDAASWAPGTLSNTFQIDPIDPQTLVGVTVTSNNGANLVPYSGAPNPMTPAITPGFQGGLPTIENTLTLAVDLTNSATQSITITISFGATGGASGVSFKLFDIDSGGPYQDQLTSIQGLSIDGTTLIAPTITTSANNLLIGTGLAQSVVGTATAQDTGPNSGRGNVTIDFGSNLIQSLTFTYGSTTAFADPAYQHFGIHDINFTPVPEVNPAAMSGLFCLGVAVVASRRRARQAPNERPSIPGE